MVLQDFEQFNGEVTKIHFFNEENGWTVFKARDIDTSAIVTVTGTLPPIQEGEYLHLSGRWSTHQTFGKQFKAERAVLTRPNSRAGILRYLSSGLIQGVGEKTATRIVDHFGLDTFKILDENPGCLIQVPKIGKKKAAEIIESWKAQKSVADVMMFLIQNGVSLGLGHRIIKKYGEQAIELISTNPYQLAQDFAGIGFLKADAIAKTIGISPTSPERVKAAIQYFMIQWEEKGHCFVSKKQLRQQIPTLLGYKIEGDPLKEELLDACLTESIDQGSLMQEVSTSFDDELSKKLIWRPDLLGAEFAVVDSIQKLLSREIKVDPDRVSGWLQKYNQQAHAPLSELQTKAVTEAVSNRVFVLTGGPGVGKTTTANAIIKIFKAMGKTVTLAAPTGRAAQRLSELSGENSKTIHRLLEWNPLEGIFAKNEDNPLASDVVICDETSMLDIRLASAFLTSVAKHSQLILIGDMDQLPSVGPGAVLRDLIYSEKVPFVRLDQVFRQSQASSIIMHAHAINSGNFPEFTDEDKTDCKFIEVDDHASIRDTVDTLLSTTLQSIRGIDLKRDVQILTPMNRGELGTIELNLFLQERLNPTSDGTPLSNDVFEKRPEDEFKRQNLRLGDKVIQTVNNYELQVFNGDIGFVEELQVNGGKALIRYSDGRLVSYSHDDLDDLRLAYAITVHKSQGSEFPVVIIPMSMQHYVMLQRNLVYTALTRARKIAIFIGSKSALQHAIRTTTSLERQTGLKQRLFDSIAPIVAPHAPR